MFGCGEVGKKRCLCLLCWACARDARACVRAVLRVVVVMVMVAGLFCRGPKKGPPREEVA